MSFCDVPTKSMVGNYKLLKMVHPKRQTNSSTFKMIRAAVNMQTNQVCAIKTCYMDDEDDLTSKRHIQLELAVFKKINHPFIVRLIEDIWMTQSVFFVFQYANLGNLQMFIAGREMDENLLRLFFQQIISALDYIHKMGIIHRNLKPTHILVYSPQLVKICDFSLSYCSNKQNLLKNINANKGYIAPELIKKSYTYIGSGIDIWASGMILHYMITKTYPFDMDNYMREYVQDSLQDTIDDNLLVLTDYIPDEVVLLIRGILSVDQNERFTIDAIRANTWFKTGLQHGYFAKFAKQEMPELEYYPKPYPNNANQASSSGIGDRVNQAVNNVEADEQSPLLFNNQVNDRQQNNCCMCCKWRCNIS